MPALIGRTNTQPRIFMFGNTGPYGALTDVQSWTPDQVAAKQILRLAVKPLNKAQQYLRWGLAPVDRIAYLLSLHYKALEAERASQWDRADFYWKDFYLEFPTVLGMKAVWDALAGMASRIDGTQWMVSTEAIRQRLVNEVFIDTHCAFYNTFALNQSSRIAVHIQYIQQLSKYSNTSQDDYSTLYGVMLESVAMRETKDRSFDDLGRSLHACDALLAKYPDSLLYQEQFTRLFIARSSAGLLNSASQSSYERDANFLRKANEQMDSVLHQHPDGYDFYQAQGVTYHLRAIKQANAGNIADALLNIQKALVYSPGSIDASHTAQELVKTMKQYQASWETIQRSLRFNQRLTEKGIKIRTEAVLGFGPMNAFAESIEYASIRNRQIVAQQRTIWRRVGLPIPAEGWNEIAETLIKALSSAISPPPSDKAELPDRWKIVSQNYPELQTIDTRLIFSFLEERIFGSTTKRDHQLEGVNPTQAVKIQLASVIVKRTREPLVGWILSRQDRSTKAYFFAMAMLIPIVAACLLFTAVSPRLAAYFDFVDAARQKSPSAIIAHVDAYNAKWPLSCNSARDSQMSQWYRDSYHNLIDAEFKDGDVNRALELSETYLSNTGVRCAQQLDEPILKLYDEIFVRWFISQGDDLDDRALQHVRNYQQIRQP